MGSEANNCSKVNISNSAFDRRHRRLLDKTFADGGAPVNWSLGIFKLRMKQYGIIILVGLIWGTTSLAQRSVRDRVDEQNKTKIKPDKQHDSAIVCYQNWQAPKNIKKLQLKNLNKKALLIPAPEYPLEAKEQKIAGRVIVEVIIDINEGKIINGRMKSGHPMLRSAVAKVFCKAIFPPANIDSRPIFGIGKLMYDFTLP